ncbi:TetR/AcrR family transcriptional regulator [Paenibacillus pasadenensis]|uniref:Transcriptional regulator, TetR family n=1 Tax=Paenibacillus pasadenensis TaxID=217090 RepID=A0A2N5N9Z0_9BACL|nr:MULTISPECIES: TetR/AcrR family transcriptional regulator [Paenibacillus]PLT47135.1 Transcriptional regulator, TetR family [Paenibacillus pasadenensis]QGG57463.1 TetR family transcriptional regulator [Paenibacillus sp. B01]
MTSNLFQEILLSGASKLTVKQERIVEAAIQLFAEKGYSNTSTAEIAKAAEVSEASIFKQYGTKEKLLLHLLVPRVKEIFPVMAEEVIGSIVRTNSSLEGFLRAFIRNRVDFALENKDILRVLIKELIYKEELKNDILPYLADVAASRLIPVIELFQQRGELIELPPAMLLKNLFTFVGGFFASRLVLLNQDVIEDEEIEEAVRFLLRGIGNPSSI